MSLAGGLEPKKFESSAELFDRLKSPNGLTPEESKMFVTLLHKLDRIRLAGVSGYALGLAASPRHTVITDTTLESLVSPQAKGTP